jgi:hypothetical protein
VPAVRVNQRSVGKAGSGRGQWPGYRWWACMRGWAAMIGEMIWTVGWRGCRSVRCSVVQLWCVSRPRPGRRRTGRDARCSGCRLVVIDSSEVTGGLVDDMI